jgi:predicted nucleic acid-binding protein
VILCDTGPLVAAFNKADGDHERCVRFLNQNWTRLVVPSLAVTEVCCLTHNAAATPVWPLGSVLRSAQMSYASSR